MESPTGDQRTADNRSVAEPALSQHQQGDEGGSRKRTLQAYGVHLLTASGIIPAAWAMFELTRPDCDPRVVLLLLLISILIDAVDGPLARRYEVKRTASAIDGRTIDDLLDYQTFSFIPLMLIWRMGWLPIGLGWTAIAAMAASLFGFAHQHAKDEDRGLFRGFPSYWNLFAVYAGVFSTLWSPWVTAIAMWVLALLTVMPVWVIYPNLATGGTKQLILWGGSLWTACLLAMLWLYPTPPVTLVLVSLVYPLYYVFASVAAVRTTRSVATD
jgi:phosphatidylcholine synthase